VNGDGSLDLLLSWLSSTANARHDVRRASVPTVTGATRVGHTAGASLVDPALQTDGQPIVYDQVVASNDCGVAAP